MNESRGFAVNESGATLTGGGWTCANCGVFVPLGQSHTCRSLRVGQGMAERPRRRHITGTIAPADRAGKQYTVDLWVEDVP